MHLFQTLDHMPLTLSAEYDSVSGAFAELQNLMSLAYEDLPDLLQPICAKSYLFSGNSPTDAQVRDRFQNATIHIDQSGVNDTKRCVSVECNAIRREVADIRLTVFAARQHSLLCRALYKLR